MIVHDKYTNATDLEILSGFLSGKYMKRLQQKYGVIHKDKHPTIVNIIRYLLTLSDIPTMWYEDVYCLIIFADPNEINSCLVNKWKIKKWGCSLPNFIAKYGNIQGNIEYKKFQDISSTRNTGKGYYQSAEHIARKYNITLEEAILKKRTIRENAYKLRIERYGEEHKRTSSPLSKMYYYNLGITNEVEIEELRRPYLNAICHSEKMYIERYGNDEGKIKFELLKQKRKNTILQRATNGIMPNKRIIKGAASKESAKFFQELIILLENHGHFFNKQEIHLGIFGYKSEYWIANKKNYYFIDFYIPKYKIAVEYDGIKFHCNNVDYWPEKHVFLKKTNQYYYNKDLEKKEAIAMQTNLFITVRSDSYNINDIAIQISDYIKNFNET